MKITQSNIDRIVDEIMKVVEHCEATVAKEKLAAAKENRPSTGGRATQNLESSSVHHGLQQSYHISPCCGAPSVEIFSILPPVGYTGIRCCLTCASWFHPQMPEVKS